MTHQWKAGDLAVCVDAGPTEDGYVPPELEKGRIYSVYGVGVDPNGDTGLFLDEKESRGYAGGYLAWRFRPLVSDTDDTALIARIRACKPARQEVG